MVFGYRAFLCATMVTCLSDFAHAEMASLMQASALSSSRPALIGQRNAPPTGQPTAVLTQAPSLFVGQSSGSFFAPYPVRIPESAVRVMLDRDVTSIDALRDLIGDAEAGRMGYDAVQYGAKQRPSKRPTDMTIAEIYDWIAATPGQPHAIGRYQFIPATLKRLVGELNLPHHYRFSPDVQDRLADILFAEAGIHDMVSGRKSRQDFMHGLSKIWAGLPTSSGKSYYHGYAGNAATISWADFENQMRRIFPS